MDLRVYVGGQLVATTTVSRVGVGEVFAITGHSNAQGGHSPSDPCVDERVISINRSCKWGMWDSQSNYCKTYSSMSTATNAIAPFAAVPWCWGPMADELVVMYNVPVLLYSAAFGGTSSEHYSKSASQEQFEHSFVRWDWRMPYTNLCTIMTALAPRTGIRAVLVLHGENDGGLSQYDIERCQTNYFHQARVDGNMPNLAFILGRSIGEGSEAANAWSAVQTNKHYVAQRNLINLSGWNIFGGPELWQQYSNAVNRITPEDIHYSTLGQHVFGVMWAHAITQQLLDSTTPYQARFQ